MLSVVARLRRIKSGETLVLAAQCLVGRSAACQIRLDDRYVSSEHAKLVWTGSKWQVRDLGSRNGTFVDGRRVEP
ncbi:MAG: FHA domain-containing protein, partial [Myxococcota bacterium]